MPPFIPMGPSSLWQCTGAISMQVADSLDRVRAMSILLLNGTGPLGCHWGRGRTAKYMHWRHRVAACLLAAPSAGWEISERIVWPYGTATVGRASGQE